MRRIFLIICIVCGIGYFTLPSLAATITSSSFMIKNPVLTSGLTPGSSLTFGLGQSLGQRVIGKSSSSNFRLWSGYQYFTKPATFTLLATSATTTTGSIVLQWTTPVIPSGDPVIGYDIGIGTTPYSYTFESVGLVTTATKVGLVNGTTYYVVVKAKTTGDVPVAFSNQATVVPSGTTPNPGGGGGSTVTGGSVIIKGLAYPSTKVVILRDGAIVATTTSDPGAAFLVTIPDLRPAAYTFGVYAEDSRGLKSSTYTFPIQINDTIALTIDNVFLSPTIGVTNSVVKQGDPIGIFGTTAPNAEVTVHVHSENQIVQKISASPLGVWFRQFDTSFLEEGDHITYSRSSLNNRVTDQSATVAFVVGTANVPAPTTARSDLNNDGKVNIIDFSMLLFYWQKTPPKTSKADITKDGTVNIFDLSIMLYDWTG